ncbi:ATP-binding protein [Mesorhizobium sp. M2A.F.Ca.ET.043.05.1.1]|uniref:ATP-binding protein n=1 Tax=Mesorhizobium sp. M2A.F.Ca.ET.043.05.1.1 TaxID=2493671 RepID=UPI001675012B|nr:ATP-binding protein [Mesorhizobium sp. M2A.F.Ca.ET.043.05.1.1]
MTSLKSNIVKRIERLPKPTNVAGAMQPLFEAVSNAIHSTQFKFDDAVTEKGKITVTVSIDRKKGDPWAAVEDNGVGLDARNFEAFTTTDTDNKITIGGKGVGRLLWLDCFENVEVNSVFRENGRLSRRTFSFVLSQEDQIKDLEVVNAPEATETMFHVKFQGLRDNGYRAKFPGRDSYVFQHFTSHFLPTFIGGRSPKITVICGDESREYPEAMASIVHRRTSEIPILTEEYGELKLTLLECDKVASSDLKGTHFVHFIAHDRTVQSQCVDGKLGLKYFGGDDNRVFHAILTGKYLDENVNQERTAFMFEDAVLDRIINVLWPHVETFLAEPLAKLSGAQRAKIDAITESYPSVAYGSTDELQAKLPAGELNEDAIYAHLSRERFRRDQRQGEKIRGVLHRLRGGVAKVEDFYKAIEEARDAIEDAEQKSLAEYVVRRKVVLDFIEVLLEKVRDDTRDSSYQREDILHSMICPVRINTLEGDGRKVEPVASHDLWIIDERLTFAQYFSSDTEFSVLTKGVQSDERPDILIFDHVHGLMQTDDPSKVLLFELKRPGRTSYDDNENPQMQIERYVKQLLAGGRIDAKGRPIKLGSDTVIYCYIVADIVGKLDEWTYSWQRTADGRGRILQPRFGFNGIIELIGWDDLLADAKARNRAFFEYAGISGKSFFSDRTLDEVA